MAVGGDAAGGNARNSDCFLGRFLSVLLELGFKTFLADCIQNDLNIRNLFSDLFFCFKFFNSPPDIPYTF